MRLLYIYRVRESRVSPLAARYRWRRSLSNLQGQAASSSRPRPACATTAAGAPRASPATSGPNCAARGRASRRLAPDPPSGTSPGPRLRASRAPSRMTRWRRLGGGGISHVSLFVFEGGGQSHDVREGAVRALARGRVHRVGGVPDEDDATPGARPPLERLPRGSGARRCRRRSPPRARGPRQSQPRARLGPPGR